MIKGIHIQSTAPSGSRLQLDNKPSCLELSSMTLSALLWKKNCGSLRLYTDRPFASFINNFELADLWDDGIDTQILDSIPASVNQFVFWSAAKIFALRAINSPVAMVDHDLFIWKDISSKLSFDAITVLHLEELWKCYVPKKLLGIPYNYRFDPTWDWNEKPCNTAFAFFPDNDFKNKYADESISFMTDNHGKDSEPSSQMVFAEQRILAMCAKRDGIPINTLIENPFDNKNDIFTHLWGAKVRARTNKKDLSKLLHAILWKIKEIEPKYYYKINDLYAKD